MTGDGHPIEGHPRREAHPAGDASAPPAGRPSGFPPGFPPERCALYLSGNEGAPPREHLVRALALAGGQEAQGLRRALDVGCGPGREAILLARAGYEVVAFDPYPEMLELTRAAMEHEPDAPTLVRQISLERATLEGFAPSLEGESFDLVHAGFVLPFVLPDRFDACFDAITRCLRRGGILCAQFFGRDDEFIRSAEAGTMSSQSREDLDRLLEQFEVLEIEEVNRQGRIGRGREKWWHVFHVIARRV